MGWKVIFRVKLEKIFPSQNVFPHFRGGGVLGGGEKIHTFYFFSRESDSRSTNVCSSVSLSVRLLPKSQNNIKSIIPPYKQPHHNTHHDTQHHHTTSIHNITQNSTHPHLHMQHHTQHHQTTLLHNITTQHHTQHHTHTIIHTTMLLERLLNFFLYRA